MKEDIPCARGGCVGRCRSTVVQAARRFKPSTEEDNGATSTCGSAPPASFRGYLMLTFGRERLEKWCARRDVFGVLASQGRPERLRVHPSVGVLCQREWRVDELSMRTAGMRGDDNMSEI